MARRKDPSKAGSADKASGSRKPPVKPERAFDVWLDKGLHTMYDSVAQEPIPEELLRLIEEDRGK